MRFYIAPKIVMSHLDPRGGPLLASREAKRMRDWMKYQHACKRKVTFLDLTYDLEQFGHDADPKLGEKIFDQSRNGKHVSRFFKRLEQHTGVSYKGKWRAKLEFTEQGIPHFHIMITQMTYVPKRTLDQIWGYGFTWVREAKLRHATYISKYQAKCSPYPDFLYDRPRRSVKIWQTSPGFFKEMEQDAIDALSLRQGIFTDDFWREARRNKSEQRQAFVDQLGLRPDGWENLTLREQIERSTNTTLIRDENGEAVEVNGIDASTLAVVMSQMNAPYEGMKYGWMRFDTHWHEVEYALEIAKRARHAIETEQEFASKARFYSQCGDEADGGGVAAHAAAPSAPLTLLKYQVREQNIIDPELDSLFVPYVEGLYDDEIPI